MPPTFSAVCHIQLHMLPKSSGRHLSLQPTISISNVFKPGACQKNTFWSLQTHSAHAPANGSNISLDYHILKKTNKHWPDGKQIHTYLHEYFQQLKNYGCMLVFWHESEQGKLSLRLEMGPGHRSEPFRTLHSHCLLLHFHLEKAKIEV